LSEKLEKLGALWQRTGPKGDYFTGEVNGVKVVIFTNGYKQSEKHPDWVVYKSEPKDAA
jgi:hypothetical protein